MGVIIESETTQMISPPIVIRDAQGSRHRVYGWHIFRGTYVPIVANPDGPGVGDWMLYHGEDPWWPVDPLR